MPQRYQKTVRATMFSPRVDDPSRFHARLDGLYSYRYFRVAREPTLVQYISPTVSNLNTLLQYSETRRYVCIARKPFLDTFFSGFLLPRPRRLHPGIVRARQSSPFTYLVIAVWLGTTVFWLTRMNRALAMFHGLFIIPALQVKRKGQARYPPRRPPLPLPTVVAPLCAEY